MGMSKRPQPGRGPGPDVRVVRAVDIFVMAISSNVPHLLERSMCYEDLSFFHYVDYGYVGIGLIESGTGRQVH
jgi:hypothetical protein